MCFRVAPRSCSALRRSRSICLHAETLSGGAVSTGSGLGIMGHAFKSLPDLASAFVQAPNFKVCPTRRTGRSRAASRSAEIEPKPAAFMAMVSDVPSARSTRRRLSARPPETMRLCRHARGRRHIDRRRPHRRSVPAITLCGGGRETNRGAAASGNRRPCLIGRKGARPVRRLPTPLRPLDVGRQVPKSGLTLI